MNHHIPLDACYCSAKWKVLSFGMYTQNTVCRSNLLGYSCSERSKVNLQWLLKAPPIYVRRSLPKMDRRLLSLLLLLGMPGCDSYCVCNVKLYRLQATFWYVTFYRVPGSLSGSQAPIPQAANSKVQTARTRHASSNSTASISTASFLGVAHWVPPAKCSVSAHHMWRWRQLYGAAMLWRTPGGVLLRGHRHRAEAECNVQASYGSSRRERYAKLHRGWAAVYCPLSIVLDGM